MSRINQCKCCVYSSYDTYSGWWCYHKKVMENPVTDTARLCSFSRTSRGRCGPTGKLYKEWKPIWKRFIDYINQAGRRS